MVRVIENQKRSFLTEVPADYLSHTGETHHHHHHHQHHNQHINTVMVLDAPKDAMASKKKIHLFKKITKRFGLVRRSSSSCPGPNNLPPLQFHTVHGDNIRLSRDGTLARRFESFCRAITFSARPVRINERICLRFSEISNNWNGGIRFGFTSNDPATLEDSLPKYACPDLTNRAGFWAKALHEQYCEKDNILYYYVNSSGDVIYGINDEEKGVILSGVDTRGLLWTLVDIYGNCTAVEFLDARIFMYQQNGGGGTSNSLPLSNMNAHSQQHLSVNAHQPARHSLSTSAAVLAESEMDRHVMQSLQSLNISNNAANSADHLAFANDLANGIPPLRYNTNGRLIPVPFHMTKGRNVRLSNDRFVASRIESEFCQGYIFTARPIRIGEKIIVQVLKTQQMYTGALALGLTSCNPAALQPNDLPVDCDCLLDRPEYWVVSKDIASKPQRGDEIAFFVAPSGEVTISKNNGPAVVVMHVDQSLQLWAFLDVYGSTQSVRMFRQQLPNMIGGNPAYAQQQSCPGQIQQLTPANSSTRIMSIPLAESINSLNNQLSESRQMLHPSQLHITHSTINSSTSTLASLQSNQMANCGSTANTSILSNPTSTSNNISASAGCGASSAASALAPTGRLISVPSTGDMIQIQPNSGGTVLVVNLPPATSPTSAPPHLNGAPQAMQARNSQCGSSGVLTGACSASAGSSLHIETVTNSCASKVSSAKYRDTTDHAYTTENISSSSSNGNGSGNNNQVASAECTICYENPIDSVLYTCGHMCMCYHCALEQWRGVGGGQCPLCRAIIRDVIRTYTT